MREIVAKGGERTRVLHILSDSIPQTVRFSAQSLSDDAPSGTVEVEHSAWIFKKPPERHQLRADQSFDKGFWDSNYSIYVTPDTDTRISFQSRHATSKALLVVIAVVVALAAVSAVLVPML